MLDDLKALNDPRIVIVASVATLKEDYRVFKAGHKFYYPLIKPHSGDVICAQMIELDQIESYRIPISKLDIDPPLIADNYPRFTAFSEQVPDFPEPTHG